MQFNKKILHVLIAVCLLFLSLTVYLTYFVLFPSAEVAKSPYDRRLWKKEDSVMRGTIYDKDGEKLAYSQMDGDTQVRVYPYGGLYTHVIGFNSRTYGKSQLELKFNDQLTGEGGLGAVVSLADRLSGGEKRGADLHLTIDHDLQSVASAQLGKRNGAVVAMNPKTGAVEVMVSTPTYDPSAAALKENWPSLAEREDAPFLNRATSGLYAPGSTFKVVTAAAAIEQNLADESFVDEGSVTIGGKEFVNQGGRVHGEIDVTRGFALSSNVVFTQLAAQMGAGVMQDEQGWCVSVACMDCGAETAHADYRTPEERLEAARRVALLWNMGKVIHTGVGD